jgi:hypothetical protein
MRCSLPAACALYAAITAAAQDQPMCLVSLGSTLFRVNSGAVEPFPRQPGEIVGLTVIPVGVSVAGCLEGDIIGVENLAGGRVWRLDNARSGTPQLVEIGHTPVGVGPCDLAFAHGRLFGITWGADFYEFDLASFAQVGQVLRLQPTTAGIGGLTFDGVTWYATNGNTDRLVRIGDPPSQASWSAVGNVGVDFNNSDLETYHGRIFGALRTPASADARLVIGTFDPQTALFTQLWDVGAATQDLCVALAAFNPACIGIDAQPAAASACPTGNAAFSVSPGGLGPFAYQWQIESPPGTWRTLGNDPGPLPCGGMAYATPLNSPTVAIGVRPCAGVASYQIRCVVSNACGTATSDEATYTVCYANCDCSTQPPVLNVSDFACFLNAFAAGEPYANCDASTSPPVLNVQDFACFLNRFAAGCP